MKKIKISIIGCGSIGSFLAKFCDTEISKFTQVVSLYDLDAAKAKKLKEKLKKTVRIATSLKEAVNVCELVVEAASVDASYDIAKISIMSGKDMLSMSSGGFFDKSDIFKLAEKKSRKIYIPSGAIAGVDAVKAAAIGGIKSISLDTIKSPKSLEGAPYILRKNINLASITKRKIIFSGTVKEAVQNFPKNINVSATLFLAASGFRNIKIRIIVDPKITGNVHKLSVQGSSGEFNTSVENAIFPDNPKTSYLAALSAASMLKQIATSIRVGS